MATPRTRTRNEVTQTGYFTSSAGTSESSRIFQSSISDIVGNPRRDNALSMTKVLYAEGGLLNHTIGTGSRKREWVSYPSVLVSLTHIQLPVPPIGSTVNRVLAGSGPLNPKVNLPLSLFELREIPKMLKHAGDLLHKLAKGSPGLLSPSQMASNILAYQFGWAPLISDISDLLGFQETTAKRKRFLDRLASGEKNVRTRMGLGEISADTETVGTINSLGALIEGRTTKQTSQKMWATCRWTQRTLTSNVTDSMHVDNNHHRAFRAAFGLNAGHIPIAVWKALPWTWFIDWFANISDVLQANYNTMYFTPQNMCIMREVTTTVRVEPTNPSEDRITPFEGKLVSKYRTVRQKPAISSPIRLPIMDSFKTSVLGSLTVLRIRRSVKR